MNHEMQLLNHGLQVKSFADVRASMKLKWQKPKAKTESILSCDEAEAAERAGKIISMYPCKVESSSGGGAECVTSAGKQCEVRGCTV